MERYMCSERENIKEILDKTNENQRVVTKHETQIKGLQEKVATTEKLVEAVHALAKNVAVLSENMRDMKDQVRDVKEDVCELKQELKEDAKDTAARDKARISEFKKEVLLIIIGGVIMYLLTIIF